MKACILKPILWNSRGYVEPSGDGAGRGYPAEHGFGHEEWNNNPGWHWRGYRVFHTQSKDSLLEFSESGNLGILMITSYAGQQLAVGVAAGAFHNTDEDMQFIANELRLNENWRQLWDLDLVRRRHNHDETAFRDFWREQCRWVRWKVEPDMYQWFKNPVPLNPAELTGKKALAKMFSHFQRVPPDRIASLLRTHIPETRDGIIRWFEEGPFDEEFLMGKRPRPGSVSRSGTSRKGNAPTSREVRYWVYGDRIAEPLHSRLQAQYVDFLRWRGLDPQENVECVDVRYDLNDQSVFVEVKPTDKVPPRFAIRAAIGQLLEYRHLLDGTAIPEIVVSTKPEAPQIDLLTSLDIRLWYREGTAFKRLA